MYVKMIVYSYLIVIFICDVQTRAMYNNIQSIPQTTFDEKNSEHWNYQAQDTLHKKLKSQFNTKIAKNVIFFIGDGMSVTTLAATRAYIGQQHGFLGEEIKLSFEEFPVTGLAKTYCVDNNVADSACSGTAYLAGVKANSGTIGVNAAVKRGNCSGQFGGRNDVESILAWAQAAGKRTGIVTTTRVTHATPASSYAHSADRRWECDSDIPPKNRHCEDIAVQLVRGLVGSKIDVILGGGRKKFLPKSYYDIEGVTGSRNDEVDLIKEWMFNKKSYGFKPKYIYNKDQLNMIDITNTNSVLGLFSGDHMPYHLEAPNEDPTLSDMTKKAVEILSEGEHGFFLFVEGGRIDTAHHETKARKALDETAELAKAVDAATSMLNLEETLVIVTSDHSHTMSYSGYNRRGSDILGFANRMYTSDKLPYMILSYANGPGYRPDVDDHRYNYLDEDIANVNFTFPSLVPMNRETHGGEDVAVYAQGPWAHLFTGNYEQNYIPHAIAYAACIGPRKKACLT